MKRRGELPELLCPAGDMDCLYAAVSGGADAVYVGGIRFGARAFAKNFDIDTLSRAVRYCHLFSVKLYVTVNTLLFDSELSEALDFCRELYAIGVDAVICQDLGLVRAIRETLPDLEIHASTQMSVNNSVGADVAYSLGCSRVVLARELSAENIRAAVEKSKAEIEVFLHGALCVCHSGQCLFSSLVGGRSGNRGECAQPCRLPYGKGYPLSLKDLSLATHIPELIELGVSSLKIEGRMKSPSYVYTVTSIYRRLLDERRGATDAEQRRLASAFSRGGFTDGYFTGRFGGMIGVRSERDKELSRELGEQYVPEIKRLGVSARARIIRGEPCQMTVFSKDRSFTAYGAIPNEARSSPLTKDSVADRLSKTGATMLSLPKENIDITLDSGLNLSPSELNALRRAACEGFESSSRPMPERKALPTIRASEGLSVCTAIFLNPELVSALGEDSLAHFEIVFVPLFSEEATSGKFGVYIPPVVTDGELPLVRERLKQAKASGAEYALVSNISHIALAKEAELIGIGDTRLNITNVLAKGVYCELGVCDAVLSSELSLHAVRDVGGGSVVYGRVPLMLTERCFMREGECGGVCPQTELVDRLGVRFPIMREWRHRNIILNSVPTFMADKPSAMGGVLIKHFIFSTENTNEAEKIISAYFEGGGYVPKSFRRIGTR